MVGIFAIKNIAEGDEITIDYQMYDGAEGIDCVCVVCVCMCMCVCVTKCMSVLWIVVKYRVSLFYITVMFCTHMYPPPHMTRNTLL